VGRATLAAHAAGKGTSRVPLEIASDEMRTHMVERLQRGIQSHDCLYHEQKPPTLTDGKEPKQAHLRISLDGGRCPVAMDLRFSFNYGDLIGAKEEMTKRLDVRYQVRDRDFRRWNDVDGFHLSGRNVFKVDLSAGASGRMDAIFDMKGSIHSQADGDLPWTVAGEVEAEGPRYVGNLRIAIGFRGLSMELREDFKKQSRGWSYRYFLNGEELSHEEFSSYLSGGGPIFQQITQPNKLISDLELR
jgi:hypothetical protein